MGAAARRPIGEHVADYLTHLGVKGASPLARVPKASEAADVRRERRALTAEELGRLLDVARRRPILDAMTIRRGRRKGEVVAHLRPEVRERLEELGRERALIYKTLVLTGLRKGELASIVRGQVHLDAPQPFIALHAADAKNRRSAVIMLRPDLASDIRQWLMERGDTCPDAPLFNVPAGLVRILDRDLRAAGIPKRDALGRTVDVHAMRTAFATHLSVAGVAPRTAQAALRHSTIDLTMNVYTDPRLLDVAGALDALPALPLTAARLLPAPVPGNLAPNLAPTPRISVQEMAQDGTLEGCADSEGGETEKADSQAYTAENRPLELERATGFEPVTLSLGS